MTTPTKTVAPVTYQSVGVQTGFLLIKRGTGQPVNIYNGDILNILLISRSPTPTLSNSVPIQPLTNATLDDSTALYASAQSGSISQVTVSAAQLSPSPAQIAQQINALGLATATNQGTQIGQAGTANTYLGGTAPSAFVSTAGRTTPQEVAALLASGNAGGAQGGIPLLRFTNTLGKGSATNLPSSATTTLINTVAVNQPGFEGLLSLNLPAGVGTVPFAEVIFNWIDSSSGFAVASRSFFITAGNALANALQYYISGPCKGNQLTVTITNLDPAQAMTLNWAINGTSHVYEHDNIYQPVYATTAPIGFTNPAGLPLAGVLLDSNPSVPASTTTTRLIAVYSGKATLGVNNTSAAGVNINVYVIDPLSTGTGLYGNAASRYEGFQALASGTAGVIEIALPYGPMLLQITNLSGTTAASMNIGIIAKDY